MKLKNLFFGLSLVTGVFVNAQETPDECTRMRYLAGKYLDQNDYKTSATYYLKGEQECGGYKKDNYDRTIGVLSQVVYQEQDEAVKKLYIDTMLQTMDRAEKAGEYNETHDLLRASYMQMVENPNHAKADELYARSLKKDFANFPEYAVGGYYYNLYMTYSGATGDAQKAYKGRLVEDYFRLSQLISDKQMSVETQNSLNYYFDYVVRSCDDILGDLGGFMAKLPKDKEQKKVVVKNFIQLLEKKECTTSNEYAMLIDTLISIDNSVDAQLAKAKLLEAKGKYSDANVVYREVKGMTTNPAQKEEMDYRILLNTFKTHSYSSAYSMAMGVSGKYRGEALKIAAQCVAARANDCGSSSFDRQCNYYYAVDLLEKARAAGADVGGLMGSYRSRFPSQEMIFNEGKSSGQSVSLSCYGVSVTIQ